MFRGQGLITIRLVYHSFLITSSFGSLDYQPGYGVGAIYGRYRTTDIDLGTEDTDEPVEAIDKNDEDDRVIIQIPYLANQGIHPRFKRDVDETEEKKDTSTDVRENENIRITYNPLALYPTPTDGGLLHLQSRDNKPSKGAILLGGLAAGNESQITKSIIKYRITLYLMLVRILQVPYLITQ